MYTQGCDLLELYEIGTFLCDHVHKDIIFNFYKMATPKLKRFFNYYVLNQMESIKLKDFTSKEVNTLIQEFSKVSYEDDIINTDELVLSKIATDAFVKKRLLPLVSSEQNRLQKNLKLVLRNIEQQLGQRYL
ncbi:MAG: hypothetical protein AAGU27_16740 [Dehalobacterium sp.]